jgi:hypothetical protein
VIAFDARIDAVVEVQMQGGTAEHSHRAHLEVFLLRAGDRRRRSGGH